jgi:hypothetical protein
MDGAAKSKRLFPSHTLAELQQFLATATDAAEFERLALAIRQRDQASPDYVPVFKVPQL